MIWIPPFKQSLRSLISSYELAYLQLVQAKRIHHAFDVILARSLLIIYLNANVCYTKYKILDLL